jgi:hypothetical protein
MAAYFLALGAGVRILQEIFKEISKSEQLAELSRVSGLAASTLDATKNVDDVIVTFLALMFAFLLILPVAWVHIITRSRDTDASLTQTLIVLSVIVAGVMLLLEDNLARSFSLVGVVAAVRFRNTLDDPKDAVLVFLALGIGMACGLQAYHVALFLSLFQCLILLILWAYHAGAPQGGDALLMRVLQEGAQKKGAQDAISALSVEARERLEAEVEAQCRYVGMANLFAQNTGKKRPNAVITVAVSANDAAVRKAIKSQMQEHRGKWRLLGAEERDGITILEFFGRLSQKHTPPLRFLERLRSADPHVQHVGFRSLRKILAEAAKAQMPRLT